MSKWIMMGIMAIMAIVGGVAEAELRGTFSLPSGILHGDPNAFVTITAPFPDNSIVVDGLDELHPQILATADTLCYLFFIESTEPARATLVGGIPDIADSTYVGRYFWFYRQCKRAELFSKRIVLTLFDGSREEFAGRKYKFWVVRRR